MTPLDKLQVGLAAKLRAEGVEPMLAARLALAARPLLALEIGRAHV